MKISLILLQDSDGKIGLKSQNSVLWRKYPEISKQIMAQTLGHSVIVGRKTFEVLPSEMAAKRNTIVLTNNKIKKTDKSIYAASTVDKAIKMSKKLDTDEIYILGGLSVFNQTLDHKDLTSIILFSLKEKESLDLRFPKISKRWEVLNQATKTFKNGKEYTLIEYRKVPEK